MQMEGKSELDSQGVKTWPEIALHLHISARLHFG